MSSPAVRARVEAPSRSFQDLQDAAVEVRVRGIAGRSYVQPVLNGEWPAVDLTPGPSSLTVVYGMRTDGLFERPSFVTGDAPTSGITECLSMAVKPSEELQPWLERVDADARQQFMQSEAARGVTEWVPLIAARGSLDAGSFKVKIALSGGRGLTDIAVKKPDGSVANGSGYEFARPLIEEYWGFRGARVKLTVRLQSVWVMGNRAGLKLQAVFAAFQPSQPEVVRNPYLDNLTFE